ncbi:hypothetical protein F4813DRAFT_393280 [Daldinia decipiens]|uniref:uncharacterized protein n=1 Tax=Daldinia decipiens TaxID=326647 RepID=UPI0020C32FBF|nr:uncharacterized protein F4813DRAFT_393280 [Daldinia decipiens]KAI1653901.1 hypothetical protein F4813DRAFT_393280 [Daldinia decipiens]
MLAPLTKKRELNVFILCDILAVLKLSVTLAPVPSLSHELLIPAHMNLTSNTSDENRAVSLPGVIGFKATSRSSATNKTALSLLTLGWRRTLCLQDDKCPLVTEYDNLVSRHRQLCSGLWSALDFKPQPFSLSGATLEDSTRRITGIKSICRFRTGSKMAKESRNYLSNPLILET